MKWLLNLINSSIGQKLLMSLTGLFLCSFLLVHLAGNLQLLTDSTGRAFDDYAYFMTHNPIIKFISIGLYLTILLHAYKGIMMALTNWKARGANRYKVSAKENASWISKNMAILGSFVFIFIGVHMAQFWGRMKFGEMATYSGSDVKQLYNLVAEAYQNPLIVLFYVISMILIGMHLWHGFQSAFQTLGLNHKKYTPIIGFLGKAFAIVIPALFALIPIMMYMQSAS